MRDSQTAEHAILDLELPVAPIDNDHTVIFIVIIALILISILSWLGLRRHNSYRSQARRRLRQLRKSVENRRQTYTTVDKVSAENRQTAFRLARIFSVGIGINSVTSTTALPAQLHQYHERWQRFTTDLSTARYASQTIQQSKINSLFSEALFWLKHWP